MAEPKKATTGQQEAIAKQVSNLYTGSASSVLSIASDFKFLNAFGKASSDPSKANKEAAAVELYRLIDEKAEKDKKWREEREQATAQAAVPSAS